MFKLLSAASIAALFAFSTAVIAADSSSQGVGSTPSATGSSDSSSSSGATGSTPSATGSSSTSSPALGSSAQCDTLTGTEKERCLREQGSSSSSGSSASPSTSSPSGAGSTSGSSGMGSSTGSGSTGSSSK